MVDQVVGTHPIDSLLAVIYLALFLAAFVAGVHRPVYGVAALVAAQPFAVYSDVFHTTITLSKVAMVGLAMGLVLRPGALSYLRELPARGFLLAGLLVAASTALSIVVALHQAPVLRETAKAFEYVALFAVAYCAYRADQNMPVVRTAVVYTILAVVLGALVQELIGAPAGLYLHNHPVPRIAGALEGPDQLAGYLDVAIAVLLAFAMKAPRLAVVIVLALAVAGEVLTFSPFGYLGASVTVAAVLFVYRRVPKLVLCGMIAGIGLAAAIIAGDMKAHEVLTVGGYARPDASVVGVPSSQSWHAALRLWRAHPLFGVGAGNAQLHLPLPGYAQAIAEGGVPLILAVLWLTYISIRSFARKTARSPLVVAALCASIGVAVYQTGILLTFYPKVCGWWWLALALGAAEVSASTGGQTDNGAQENPMSFRMVKW